MENPRLTQLQVKQFQTCIISKKQEKRRINTIFEMYTKLFLVGIKAQRDKGGGKILLGGNTAGGVAMPKPIWFQCIGVWISTGTRLYMYIQLTICILSSYSPKFDLC